MSFANKPRSRVRVAHVTLGLEMGGQEKLLVEFARHADRNRFDLVFVSMTGRGCLAEDIQTHGWTVATLEQPPGLRPGMIFHLAKFFLHNLIDVVHTHDDKPLIYGALAARMAGVPRTIHSRHGRSVHNSARQNKLVAFCSRWTDQFVCVSDESAQLTVQQGINRQKVRAILNGIDVGQFDYRGPCPGGPVVTVARLCPEKDVGTLIRATAIAVRAKPEFRLEIAGDGPCRADLERLVSDLRLGEHVLFHGQVRDVASWLGRASLFVLPSVSEGISLTLLEAMARGLPVVATRIGGTPEVVADGETGLLVPAQRPSLMAEAMLRIAGDFERSRLMGLAGRIRVERLFDIRRMVEDYQRLYCDPDIGKRPSIRRINCRGRSAKELVSGLPVA
jgi:glycosyltransferase involved in cell wall biosynthesis